MLGTMLYTRKPVSLIRIDNPLQTMAWAAAIAGITKLLAMLLLFGMLQGNDPAKVLQFISSGFMGEQAFDGGFITIAAGVVFHLAVVFALVWFLFVIYPVIPLAGRSRWLTGLVYGILIWSFMTFIVLPLSYAPQPSFGNLLNVLLLISDVLLLGMPMALIIGRHYAVREEKIAHARELFDPSSIYY
jgi:hypothetical protein